MQTKTCSLAIVGDGSVGKSSIIAAFKSEGFNAVYKQTIGIDFYEKTINVSGNINLSLKVWDVGGQSVNSKNLDKYLSSADVIFLTYDSTNSQSFDNLSDWLLSAKRYAKNAKYYLIANKVSIFINYIECFFKFIIKCIINTLFLL